MVKVSRGRTCRASSGAQAATNWLSRASRPPERLVRTCACLAKYVHSIRYEQVDVSGHVPQPPSL